MQSRSFFALSVLAFIVAYVIGWHLFKSLSHGLSNDTIFFAPIPQIPKSSFSNACYKMCVHVCTCVHAC
jgi:biotin transporter BioY